MKKRILALACAMVMVFAMSLSVCAAPSVTDEALVSGGVELNTEVLAEIAKTTTVTSGTATIKAVSQNKAAESIQAAEVLCGSNAIVAAVFDMEASAGGTFTVACPKVAKGMNVVVLHQLDNGTWETIKPSSIANGSITFSINSFSPVAIVVNGTASKTADMAAMAAVMALVSAAGAAVCSKKSR